MFGALLDRSAGTFRFGPTNAQVLQQRRYLPGTMVLETTWLVTALAMIGETGRAHALCQKLLSFAGPLGLYAEEIDTTAGEHLGNFPQAFTHLALIEAVSQLIEMEPKEGSAFVA